MQNSHPNCPSDGGFEKVQTQVICSCKSCPTAHVRENLETVISDLTLTWPYQALRENSHLGVGPSYTVE